MRQGKRAQHLLAYRPNEIFETLQIAKLQLCAVKLKCFSAIVNLIGYLTKSICYIDTRTYILNTFSNIFVTIFFFLCPTFVYTG